MIKRIRALVAKDKPNYVPLDIGDAVREVLALTRGEFDRRRVSVHTDLPADLPRVRRCRWRRVRPAMTS